MVPQGLGKAFGQAVVDDAALLPVDAYRKDLGGVDKQKPLECIEACVECAQACTACADGCLGEDRVAELTKCIRTETDCADICDTTGRVLSRHTGYDAT